MMLSVFINGIISAEISLFIFVYLLIFLTLIGYEFFLHCQGFCLLNDYITLGWLVRTTINLFLLSLMAELKQILQLKNSCIFSKLPHFWPLTLIAFSNYGTSLVNLYLSHPPQCQRLQKHFATNSDNPFANLVTCKIGAYHRS